MSKLQLITLSAAVLLLLVLMFAFDTKPDKQAAVEQTRALRAESTDISSLLKTAKEDLPEREATSILLMEQALDQAANDSIRVANLEQLSRKWFDLGHPEISGHFAEVLAETSNTEEAWSIAGTTYAIGVQRATSAKVKTYCNGRAVQAFENAISINPQETAHKLNLALCYTEFPPKDNPMKGILMLIDLNKKYPDDTAVLSNLGRLAIQTGQFEKAVQRLERVVNLEPNNTRAYCLLVEAYRGLGNTVQVEAMKAKCQGN